MSLLFIPVPAFAADPCPDCNVEIFVDDVSGGLSTTLPDYKIGNQFSPYMRNVMIDNGKIELVGGFTEIGSTNALKMPTGIFTHVQDDGSKNYIVADSSVVLYTQDFNFFTFISSGLNTGVLLRCTQIRSNMWCSNGSDPVFSWDGETRTDLNGENGTPDVPKGKYIEYYQERVFVFNLPNFASQARYSDFRSTNGVQIAPENFLAWPAGNAVNVGQGDGEVGTGIWIENGQLQFGKERSIYTLFGNNPSNYTPIKTSPDVGVVSHDSVVLMDGQANFLGPDGFFVGRTRVSDHIETEVESINKQNQQVIQNVWDSQEDFGKGEFSGSTATVGGLVVQISTTWGTVRQSPDDGFAYIRPSTSQGASDPGVALTPSTTFYGEFVMNFQGSTEISTSAKVVLNRLVWPIQGDSAGQCTRFATVTVTNLHTGIVTKSTMTDVNSSLFTFPNRVLIADGEQIFDNSLSIKIEGCDIVFNEGTINQFLSLNFINSTTFQYMSDVATNTNITAWAKFNTDENLNGGTVDYYVRTGTDAFHVTNSTRTWVPQSPGTNISAPLGESYVQWAATMTTISTTPALGTQIDNVSIEHIEGAGASNRAFAEKWKNRYWVFTSTENTNRRLGFIKAKNTSQFPIAWMPIEGINISAMESDGETLYAGASSTGTFYRLDFGTNYNGEPIQGIYHTPSKFMNDLFTEKTVYEYYIVDDRSIGKEITLGLSIDGKDFVDQNVSFDGTGQVVKTIRRVRQPNITGKLFKFKFDFNQLDKELAIKNFGVLYKPSRVRSGINE